MLTSQVTVPGWVLLLGLVVLVSLVVIFILLEGAYAKIRHMKEEHGNTITWWRERCEQRAEEVERFIAQHMRNNLHPKLVPLLREVRVRRDMVTQACAISDASATSEQNALLIAAVGKVVAYLTKQLTEIDDRDVQRGTAEVYCEWVLSVVDWTGEKPGRVISTVGDPFTLFRSSAYLLGTVTQMTS